MEENLAPRQAGETLEKVYSSPNNGPLKSTSMRALLSIAIPLIVVGFVTGMVYEYSLRKGVFTFFETPALGIKKDAVVESTSSATLTKTIAEVNRESEYLVNNSRIIVKYQNHERDLFLNAKDVKEVRIGPDGETLHFRTEENENRQYCVHTDPSLIESEERTDDFLTKAWDFKKLGHYKASLKTCQWKSGGYLKKNPLFVYVALDRSNKAQMHIQNLDTMSLFLIELDDAIAQQFDEMTSTPESSSTGLNVLMGDGEYQEVQSANAGHYELITDSAGLRYLYPQYDSHMVNNKLLLSFGDVFIAIDVGNKKLLGGFNLRDFNAAAHFHSYLPHSSEKVPLVVIENHWEGPSSLVGIIDFSGEKIKFVPFEGIFDTQNWSYFVENPVEWKEASVVIHKEKYEYIKLPLLDKATQDEIDNNIERKLEKERELIALHMKTGKYLEVMCDASDSMTGPAHCMGFLKENLYEYKIGSTVVKIN